MACKLHRFSRKEQNKCHDPDTVDLFSQIVQIREKHEWFLRQVLKKQDGLAS